jgi:hypothetical protein
VSLVLFEKKTCGLAKLELRSWGCEAGAGCEAAVAKRSELVLHNKWRYLMQQADCEAIDKLADWIKQVRWTFFCTFTFAWRVSDRQAEKVFKAFVNRLERHLRCEVGLVRGDEKRFSGCGMPASGRHFHAVMTCTAPVEASFIESLWTSMAGSRADGAGAKVKHYDPSKNGVGYILKFINQPDGNWAFRNLELYHPDAKDKQKMNKRWRRRLKRFDTRKEQFAESASEEN